MFSHLRAHLNSDEKKYETTNLGRIALKQQVRVI